MPCRDDWVDADQMNADRRHATAELGMVTASLCAVMTRLEQFMPAKDFLAQVDWAEAGVLREDFDRWWKEHKAEDVKRRRAEAKERERVAAREAALAKLTPAERKLLGVR